MQCLAIMLALLGTVAAAETRADQQAQPAAATALLERATGQATGRPFAVSRRIHVDLDSRVVTTWLAAVASN